MQFLPFLLILYFFLSLFCLYVLAKDDFVLLRRNITLEQIFNLAFETALIGLFGARFFYVLFNFDPKFLHPLVFFLFNYFPGLSLAGGVLGGMGFLLSYSFYRKMPTGRLFDFFALSLLSSLPVSFLVSLFLALLTRKTFVPLELVGTISYIVLFIFLTRIFLQGKFKDGSVGLLSLLSFSTISFLFSVIERWKNFLFFQQKDNFLLIALLVTTLVFLIKQEKLMSKLKKFRRE